MMVSRYRPSPMLVWQCGIGHRGTARVTLMTVAPPIDRLLLAKMSETNFRSCAAICRDFRVSA